MTVLCTERKGSIANKSQYIILIAKVLELGLLLCATDSQLSVLISWWAIYNGKVQAI